MSIKQVIVMRTDLNMRKGKMVAQGAHASMAFISRNIQWDRAMADGSYEHVTPFSRVQEEWFDKSFTKICVGVSSEEELLRIAAIAEESDVVCHVVEDNGQTEFAGVKTVTCLALGPDYSEKIDKITGHLKLL